MRTVTRRIVATQILTAAEMAIAEEPVVAGVNPTERLARAPGITEFTNDGAGYTDALSGAELPYPACLKFFEDQGPRYTPFTRPGMTGPCEIR